MVDANNELKKLREAARRRERDFITLFNALWYRDFPIIAGHELKAHRAMWTTHIASVVKACADLMGFFTLFERGNRTDAIIQKANGTNWAKIEWEWDQPFRQKVNEIQKLSDSARRAEADVFIFIGYSWQDRLEESLKAITSQWKVIDQTLLVFILIFKEYKQPRQFRTMQTYRINKNTRRKLGEQYALPWNVPDTRWQASAEENREASAPRC